MRYVFSLLMFFTTCIHASAQAQAIHSVATAHPAPVISDTVSIQPAPYISNPFTGSIDRTSSEQINQSVFNDDAPTVLSQLPPDAVSPTLQLEPDEYTNRLLNEKGLQ